MTKFRIFLDFRKEEKWLEGLAAQGWTLKKKNILYKFESSPPKQANIKIDYRVFKKGRDFIDYLTLFEDSGWRHIAGTKSSGTQYFMQAGTNCEEDIFSDAASRVGRYKRASNVMLSGVIAFLPLFIISVQNSTSGLDAFLNPKALYYTPGLWELSGTEFWGAFLFETPFALGRGFAWILAPLLFVVYVFLAIKSWLIYKHALKTDIN